ncbi:RNA methyltransferase [Lacisediminimonas profundi]|uniref:RNA methyltransferase n=1 Tax=Lacisediminimonas profundi TaxID=2603856 RepID=UPI00124B75C2|nr:RNA methyltransferase [Lacisediminimonas profundi]
MPNSLFSRLRFVLVETSHPGNIGAAARAMKTMGFSELVLVRPRFADALRQDDAIAFASGALDVLENAKVVETLAQALDGVQYAAALSSRLREYSPPVVSPREFAAVVAPRADLQAALVFGSERYGLSNDSVMQCQALVNIPANPAYSSLNLAQAVQLLAYECRVASDSGPADQSASRIGFQGELASAEQVEGMYVHLEHALVELGFLDAANPKKLMPRLRRLFSRTGLETEEVNILRGIAGHVIAACKK